MDIIFGWFWEIIGCYIGDFWVGLLDGIIGLDYWMVFFLPNSEGTRGPQGHSSQGRFSFLRHIFQNRHKWSKKVISGSDFLKNDDIWPDFIKLDQNGSN